MFRHEHRLVLEKEVLFFIVLGTYLFFLAPDVARAQRLFQLGAWSGQLGFGIDLDKEETLSDTSKRVSLKSVSRKTSPCETRDSFWTPGC